jgi:hypothetical protein
MMMTLPPDYRPSDDEEFMSSLQIAYFRQRLLRWRNDLLRDADAHWPVFRKAVFTRRILRIGPVWRRIGRWSCEPVIGRAS